MKRLMAFLTAVLLSAPCYAGLSACDKKETDYYPVYLILGQSNAGGNGKISDLPAGYRDKEYVNVKIFCGGSCNAAAKNRLMSVGTKVGQGSVSSDRFGVEIGIADYFTQKGVKAGLIKCGFDGSSINLSNAAYGSWWTETDEIPASVIKCYEEFFNCYSAALNAFKDNGYLPVIKGVVWLQGESNAEDASYSEHLDKLIKKLREDLDIQNLYFIAGTISYVSPGNYSKDCAVNAAIRELSGKDNCGFIESGNYPTDPYDTYHWSGKHLLNIGRDFAKDLYEKTLD